MINGLDIITYKKLHGQGLTLPGTVIKEKDVLKNKKDQD